MLTIIADAMLTATRQEKWPAPDHWKAGRPARGAGHHDREAAYWRRRLQRDSELW
ncbi:hypothetical protein [Cognatiyoonia sp. IB215182]|uniref:hypothetical protein n=1 Tax=Cognatiyoonia sp. IB215182 TaxID=3097353 RepID=UPI002A0D0B03|nr:hypothetical protein [Cognatiyoonia sp. IB215182]MDX8354579.1 hypothetical protein [Cognatiyoonia sp. IB215182]